MTHGSIGIAGLVVALVLAAACSGAAVAAPNNAPRDTLTAFRSDEEFVRFLKRVRKQPPPMADGMMAVPSPAPPPPPPPPPSVAANGAAPPAQAETVTTTGSRVPATGEKITNTQEENVDEGDIVKMHGDTLVILRRGRLFTVSTKNGALKPIDYINAYPPGVDPSADWYDEMLVAGNRVIVIGYSYGRGGTEIVRFHIDEAGRLDFDDAYHLRSNDYYSSRNYASRLIGTELIVYSPLNLPYGEAAAEKFDWLPGLRRWSGDPQAGFTRIVSARHIYLPEQWRDGDDADVEALHTVSRCDLAADVLKCDATSVLGPNGRTFYVSSHAVYVWLTPNQWNRAEDDSSGSLLYRLPLDGSAPSAIGVRGAPVDQFSFREDWDDGVLNVLVRSEGGGDAMWRPEFSEGDVALLRMPLRDFGDGEDDVLWRRYRELPKPKGEAYAFQNRYVGSYLLYGTGNSWGSPQDRSGALYAVNVHDAENDVAELKLEHGIDRIEAMGADAVAVGSDTKDLHFQAVELTLGREPLLGDDYVMRGASQGETRSHAFFFKPERSQVSSDTAAGVLGLPIARAARPAYRQLVESSAAMLFLRRTERKFVPLGEIAANEEGVRDDACKASCVDWYGNARPIFLGERTFALMGYELVEGKLGARSIREVRRINFAPTRGRRAD